MSDLNIGAGSAVARFRKRIGMQQTELAELLGKTRATVSNIERGKQAMSLVMFCRIAEILHVDPAKLLNEAIRPQGSIGRDKLVEKGVHGWTIDLMRGKLPESSIIFVEGGNDEQKAN